VKMLTKKDCKILVEFYTFLSYTAANKIVDKKIRQEFENLCLSFCTIEKYKEFLEGNRMTLVETNKKMRKWINYEYFHYQINPAYTVTAKKKLLKRTNELFSSLNKERLKIGTLCDVSLVFQGMKKGIIVQNNGLYGFKLACRLYDCCEQAFFIAEEKHIKRNMTSKGEKR